ncbi:MAG: VWA domain-containing protein [Candidatus Lokiarchaeota archaeon]|nr:VWA domain-containing protein [Candidatus Lokiarchaeota archaeon]
MPETQVENICIVLDCSRSMFRHDYDPNRFEVCKEAIINLIRTRRSEDQKTGFALITVGKDVKKNIGFSDYTDPSMLHDHFDNNVLLGGPSKISDGIGIAIKMHIEAIRIAGAKVPKIVVFSDGNFTPTKVEPAKMAEIAKGLEIKIDTIRLGEMEHFNILKRISELTNGTYYYCNSINDVLSAAITIAESNKGKKYQKSKSFTKILEKIAVPLKTIAELKKDASDIVARIRGTASFKKCGICFQEQDPITKAPFNISGRYCPNCGQGFHIHCMSQWAQNNEDSGGTVTRCPHCFYLVKIPSEVQQAARIKKDLDRERKSKRSYGGSDQYYAKKYIAKNLGDAAIYSACPVCNTIFDENEEVIKCGNPKCNAIYHLDCIGEVENKPCKICGKKIVRSF